VPGDGQSTVALGLAVAWAAAGARVLLVDLSGGEDLARALHLGRATAAEHAADLLTALSRGEAPVPAPSVLEGISVVSGGATLALEPDAVADAVLRRSSDVQRALREASRGYTRVLVDGPAWPPAYTRAVESLADHVLEVSEVDPLHGMEERSETGAHPSAGRPPLGTVLNRWTEADGPDAAWLTAAIRSGRWLDTTLPRTDTLRGLWDLVDGGCGVELDSAFVQLARELDARIARGAA
jgi:Mrp family chromosome partitioning ATPase